MNQNLFVNDEPRIGHRYQYGPYGEPMSYDNHHERQGFI